MKALAILLSLALVLFSTNVYAQEPNNVIPPFTDPEFPYPKNSMFKMPALIDCGKPEYVQKVLDDFKEVPVGDGMTFVVRPDGIMQPGPFTFYANPETSSTSIVIKFEPPFGPGIWCMIHSGTNFAPARQGDAT